MAPISTGVVSVVPSYELPRKGEGSSGPSSRTRTDERGEHGENCSGRDRVCILRGLVSLTLVAAAAIVASFVGIYISRDEMEKFEFQVSFLC